MGGTGHACPPKVTVKINLWAGAVACPGHSHEIRAVGDPPGGTFSWSVSGEGATLVDIGGNPTNTGPRIWLRSFNPNNNGGFIPEQKARVSVTYTHPRGKATDRKDVKIHKIDFSVTNKKMSAMRTGAQEAAASVTLWNFGATSEMSANPKVEIRLDASCPRKTLCAQNHRVGWLQTMLTNDRRIRYYDTLITWTAPMPIRDVWDPDSLPPFYHGPFVMTFAADRDKKTAHHEDSPSLPASWTDPRPVPPLSPTTPAWLRPSPLLRVLRQMFFSNSFTAWLVVQNIEWAGHDMPKSFVYLGNLDWSIHLDVAVDTKKAVGSRCKPKSRKVKAGKLKKGKGGRNPSLKTPFFNTSQTSSTAPAPPLI